MTQGGNRISEIRFVLGFPLGQENSNGLKRLRDLLSRNGTVT